MKVGRKKRIGTVLNNKCDKTAVVAVERIKKDPKIGKRMKTIKKYKAHDEKNECKEGFLV